MKKVKLFTVFILILSMLMCFPGCISNALSAPTGWEIDDDNRLSWAKVEDARRYLVEVTDVTTQEVVTSKESIRTYYSLAGLPEGDYEIRIMAISGNGKNSNSDWSEVISFHRDYESGLVYSLINNNSEYEILRIGTAKGAVIIEDVYRGKPVTRIADRAFSGKGNASITEVHLGKNITSIGAYAFNNCSALTKINLHEGITDIGEHAFQSCRSLTEITVPNSITTLNAYTFAYCNGLTKIDMGTSITSIGEYAFLGCSSLPEVTIPDQVESMGANAFYNCTGLEQVTIGDGLKKIDEYTFNKNSNLKSVNFSEKENLEEIAAYAFKDCFALESIVIPEGVKTIGEYAFDMGNLEEVKSEEDSEVISYTTQSKLSNVTIPDSLEKMGSFAFNGTKLHLDQKDNGFIYADKWLSYVEMENRASITRITIDTLQADTVGLADGAFRSSPLLEGVILPAAVKHLGDFAFYNCPSLYSFRANKNLLTIGNQAFYGDSFLSSVQLTYYDDMKLESIGNYAFLSCTSLDNKANVEDSILPNSVKHVGAYAFYDTKIWSETSSGVLYAGNWVVGYEGSVGTVNLKSGTRGIADYAFEYCENLMGITGLQDVYHIGKGAFYKCPSLITAPINSNITKIEDYTFFGCADLTRVSFSATLKEIGNYAFSGCTNLSDADLSRTRITSIGEFAFNNCNNLRSLKFNDDVVSIGKQAFYNNYLLESVEIPDSVTQIGVNAFGKCEALKSVVLSNSLTEINNNLFYGCISLESVTIPQSVTSIGDYAFYKCAALKSIEFSDNIVSIGRHAFAKSTSLTSIKLPDSLETIGAYAFRGCESLETINLSKDILDIGVHAFYGCKILTVYTDAEQGKWLSTWNSGYRPVFWEANYSEDGTYVVSIEVDKLKNDTAKNANLIPQREGYAFVGWTTIEGSTTPEYPAELVYEAPAGSVLYTIWQAN